MEALNFKPLEHLFQFVETRLSDGTYLRDDEEALIEYSVQKPEPENGIAGQINVEAVIPFFGEGNLSDFDILDLLAPETIDAIKTEIIEDLV